jgi:hypothetical protein
MQRRPHNFLQGSFQDQIHQIRLQHRTSMDHLLQRCFPSFCDQEQYLSFSHFVVK